MFELRDYQKRACELVRDAWGKDMQRPAVVLPTGAGKTVTFAELIRRYLVAHPDKRVVVVAHTAEIIEQTAGRVGHMTGVPVGIVKAERDETHARVVVASAQTLAVTGRSERLRDVGLVVVDECHHYAARTWKDVLLRLGCFAENGPVTVGFTATMSRGDGAGLGGVWEDVVYQRSILRMIMDGHLCDVKALSIEIDGLDLGKVARKAGGDFADGSLGDAMEAAGAHTVLARAYVDHATVTDAEGTRVRQGVVFTPTVRFARAVAASFDAIGVSAAVVTGDTSREDRALIYKRYREGEVRVLCNCMVLTEGWDAPWAEVAVIARPTNSNGLYTQMVGRVLRTHPGKQGALVLHACGTGPDNTLCGLVDLSEDMPPAKDGETLTEAVERVARESSDPAAIEAASLRARRVEMFKRLQGNWLQTRRGWWFNRTKRHTWFVWPVNGAEGSYLVGRFDNKGKVKATGVWLKDGTPMRVPPSDATRYDLSFAMLIAEGFAIEDDPSIAGRNAPWRKAGGKKAIPSREQLEWAWALGIKTDGLGKNELSQKIDIRLVDEKLHGRR